MSALNAGQAAEHAGRWKADHGQAPHYSRAALELWPCYACPLDDCDWHHDDDTARPSAPALLEAKVLEHLSGHSVVDVLRSLQAARDAGVAVRESNNRAWDVVNLHRLRAVHRGEHAYSDPVGQMLSAALIGTAEHEDVRRELTQLSEGVVGARDIASVPVAKRDAPVTAVRTPHQCDELCRCPVHGTALYFTPASNEHACQNPTCRYAHGISAEALLAAPLVLQRCLP